jgi:hypothetical protein
LPAGNGAPQEMEMRFTGFVIAFVTLAVMAADPAAARARHKAKPHCAELPTEFSLEGFLFNPRPRPNGCAPPVYAYGEYVGQDPDPFIRSQLKRDPTTGYAYDLAH